MNISERIDINKMIEVTRLNDTQLIINAELIQTIETTPDTVITLTNGMKYLIKENSKDIIEKVIAFRRRINSQENIEKGNLD